MEDRGAGAGVKGRVDWLYKTRILFANLDNQAAGRAQLFSRTVARLDFVDNSPSTFLTTSSPLHRRFPATAPQ